ncbi:MAG: hypothetical protein VE98_C0001G0497 [candidate division Kazan bacterium GW2011_GWA1_50_15]|uniref:Uncharacterized protein n=2 Tax=Bacteria division Kazan-3B-28 TaxID=1798534 RepID=A0A0G1X8P8_UNCK3|nr:MAG: hypothetical protein VE98_C0001G0497 [candidate division Kazan bacterium GW2011_GWA1_50_15]KKW25815.1 MAG: hypothetical protein VE99_C0001G0454 [candidate division Kazan bacterium GW2011_GWC1_52_13]KKW27170.1 MAG: hypothetical protein VF00_C0001G0105 [candidate division Kazan bacterium GW2011_GWB1_52_7]HCR42459.1 hypothetical protein [Patescibacteria group bacterium]
MNNQQFDRLVQNLQDIMRCPHCSAKYTNEDVHYLGQLDSMTFLHMRCGSCHTPVFASVALANESGDILSADVTADDIAISDMPASDPETLAGFDRRSLGDAEPREIPVEHIPVDELFSALNPVSYDDVLDAHEYLAGFSGDLSRLIGR